MTTPRPMTMRERIALLKSQPMDMAYQHQAAFLLITSPELDAALVMAEVAERGVSDEVRKQISGALDDWEASEEGSGYENDVAFRCVRILQDHSAAILASATNAARLKEAEGLLREWLLIGNDKKPNEACTCFINKQYGVKGKCKTCRTLAFLVL